MLDQLDVTKPKTGTADKTVLDALSSFKQAREQGAGKVQLTGVAAKIAQQNAYRQFIEENLGAERQGPTKKDKKKTFIE